MTEFVKPICGILTGNKDSLPEVLSSLENYFGKADIVGKWIPFDHTNYYEPEMGPNLSRCFVSFENLVEPFKSGEFKNHIKEIEENFSVNGKRMVNLDPGYLDANKVVLITGKHGGHKIALSLGIWADMLLWYNKGWVALPWAFPDFRDGRLFPVFTKIRIHFKEQLRSRPGP